MKMVHSLLNDLLASSNSYELNAMMTFMPLLDVKLFRGEVSHIRHTFRLVSSKREDKTQL